MPGTEQSCKTRGLLRRELGVTPFALLVLVAKSLAPSVSRDAAGYKASIAKGMLELREHRLNAHQRSYAA